MTERSASPGRGATDTAGGAHLSAEDADVAEATAAMQAQQAAYQAALAVTAKVVQPSLLDFLR